MGPGWLVLTRKFAEMLGGEVSATSVLNEGATFTMTLPRRIETAAQPASPRAITEAESEYRGTVLVIDDDEEHHETMAHSLPKNGYRLLHARGGAEGLELARSHRPDLITLDIIMDGQDGWSVLSELKKDPALNGVPVIILTISRNRELAYSLGAADFVTKPFDAGALAQLIGRRSDGEGSSQILVVDDDPAARDMLRRWFVHQDWNVKEVADGAEALAWLQRNVPHLIVLDLLMPGIDGFEVLDRVRDMASLADVPVVVSTVKELTGQDSRRLRGKANNVLRKGGYDKETLLGIVRNHLHHHGPATASSQAQ